MLRLRKFIAFNIIKLALWTRYKVDYQGLDKLNKENLSNSGGVLFLPNHPAEVDPLIVGCGVWKSFEIRPVLVDWIIKVPVIGSIVRLMRAIPVPDFDAKGSQFKRKQAEKVFSEVVSGLKNGENFLFYPAGRLRFIDKEIIGGASGIYRIVQENPDINIVLVRTTNLWGSTFSKGWDGNRVSLLSAILHSVKALLKNGFFFLPRRKVQVYFEPANTHFLWDASRHDLNRYLENWYNEVYDPLHFVPYQFWSKKIKRPYHMNQIQDFGVKKVPQNVKDDVIEEIARISKHLYTEIKPEMNLFSDLRLDSLDIQDLISYLDKRFGVSSVKSNQLSTVASVMNYASKSNSISEGLNIKDSSLKWKDFADASQVKASIQGESIPEAFFNVACLRKKDLACADLVSGELTYERVMLGVILLSKKIKKLPGKYIGVLLPASVAVNMVIIACQLAKKIPVMINWTVGKNHLEAVLKVTKLEKVITSNAFLKNIGEVDLSLIASMLVPIEAMRKSISLYEKLIGVLYTKLSYSSLYKKLNLTSINKGDPAVLLFTSGTETMPKGVPLSHENILSDMKSAFNRVRTSNKDVILGFLPAFHSYGFTVGGILPLVSGVRVVYYPNPIHYKKLSRIIDHYNVTFLAGAPTFLKGILQPSQKELYSSLRVIISGAEKAQEALLNRVKDLCPQAEFLEGYGLSECGPILTLNVPNEEHQGVGKPLDGVDVAIINPETYQRLDINQNGLVIAKGANIFNGYLGYSESSPFMNFEGSQWFKTGDLGYLDKQNRLTLVGRLKRQIKIGGEMVNLNAIEDKLTKDLIGGGIIKIEENDSPALAICSKETSDRPKIILFTTFDIALDDVNKKIRKLGFSNLHKISQLEKIDQLPMMASGKIHYRRLEESL